MGILVRGRLRRELALLTAQSWGAQGGTEKLGRGEKEREKSYGQGGKSLKMKSTAGCSKVVGRMQLGNLSGSWTGASLGWKLEDRDSGNNHG